MHPQKVFAWHVWEVQAPSRQVFGCLGDIYFEVASFFCADVIGTGAELGFSN